MGASYIFGPQKGATSEMVIKLDKNLQNFSKVIYEKFNVDVSGVAGGGAAGGLGAAFLRQLQKHSRINEDFFQPQG